MEERKPNMPLLGDLFPELKNVKTTHGLMNLPDDLKGSWFVLFGDRIIVPPPGSIKEAEERLKKYEGYDWWFCHKPLEK
ncbi:MAG: hypothetical protein Q7J65_06955 [Candidatus Marinimicrobia bacterium]|nr:hypothetical protein [Candidatus Neomarinimicrobiota bacterium]